MALKDMTNDDAIVAINEMTAIEDLRDAAKELEVSFSGNTGVETLKTKILTYLDAVKAQSQIESVIDFGGQNEEIQIAKPIKKKEDSVSKLLTLNAADEPDANKRRQIIRAQALRLVRVRIQNLDPADAPLSGGIYTVQNKYLGKVSKYIPFGEESENGYHVPQILLDLLQEMKFVYRKEQKGGRFGVKTYKTSYAPKFNIEILPPLTSKELQDLAALQRASQSIDS